MVAPFIDRALTYLPPEKRPSGFNDQLKTMKIIVGLGNPGKEYTVSRHNVGFMCLNYFAKQHKIPIESKKAHARTGEGVVGGVPVVLAKPFTFMNRSGHSVKEILRKHDLKAEDLIVVHDDMDLPLGKIRIRVGGSSAGHKGITSIIAELATPEFTRLRVGIGHPEVPAAERGEGAPRVIDYVLKGFSTDEKAVLNKVIARVDEAIVCIITSDVGDAMTRFNGVVE
jgi:PTH1 family peptidyl-tRNA hydrolase